MEIFKCKRDGFFSLSNQSNCPICDGIRWEQADKNSLTTREWQIIFNGTGSPKEELLVAEAWAKTGAAEGIMLLAEMYMSGSDACPKDEKKSVELLRQLLDKRYPEGMTLLGSCYIFGTGVKEDYKKGLDLLWKARDMNDGDAAYLLGMLYENGIAVTQDIKKSKKLFKQAAENGADMGMLAHGMSLMENAKSTKDTERALFWLWKAACEGLGEAQMVLGVSLSKSCCSIQDKDQAIYWLNRATENECDGAASALASVCLDPYVESPIGPEDILLKLQQALNRGDAKAAKTLGDFYKDGVLVDPDPDRAYKFYRVGQGRDKDCSAAVAHCYHYGIGVEKNVGIAYCILTDLIDLDHQVIKEGTPVEAIIELGDMYRDGEGTAMDPCKAINLYTIAGSNGDARGLGRVARELIIGNQFITAKTTADPIALLKDASAQGDIDSILFLAKHFLASGDREQAAYYAEEALFYKDYYAGRDVDQFVREYFPELIE